MKWLERLPLWLRIILSVLAWTVGVISFIYVGTLLFDAVQVYPIVFMIVWLAIPLILAVFRFSRLLITANLSHLQKMRKVSLTITIVISMFLFQLSSLRDWSTALWESPIRWVLGWLMIAVFIFIPWLTYRLASKIIASAHEHDSYNDNQKSLENYTDR